MVSRLRHAWAPYSRETPMKIEDHIFEQMCARGEHYPITPSMIRYNLPSIEDFRKVIPPLMSSEDLEWIYLRHVNSNGPNTDHGRAESPEWRSRLMYYINNFVKLRLDPDFISSEAAICHLSNNNLQKYRWKVIREMELAGGGDGSETDFAKWYTNKGHKDCKSPKYIPTSHDGRPVLSRDDYGWYATHYPTVGRFAFKRAALRYAKAKSQERFLDMLERAL